MINPGYITNIKNSLTELTLTPKLKSAGSLPYWWDIHSLELGRKFLDSSIPSIRRIGLSLIERSFARPQTPVIWNAHRKSTGTLINYRKLVDIAEQENAASATIGYSGVLVAAEGRLDVAKEHVQDKLISLLEDKLSNNERQNPNSTYSVFS